MPFWRSKTISSSDRQARHNAAASSQRSDRGHEPPLRHGKHFHNWRHVFTTVSGNCHLKNAGIFPVGHPCSHGLLTGKSPGMQCFYLGFIFVGQCTHARPRTTGNDADVRAEAVGCFPLMQVMCTFQTLVEFVCIRKSSETSQPAKLRITCTQCKQHSVIAQDGKFTCSVLQCGSENNGRPAKILGLFQGFSPGQKIPAFSIRDHFHIWGKFQMPVNYLLSC